MPRRIALIFVVQIILFVTMVVGARLLLSNLISSTPTELPPSQTPVLADPVFLGVGNCSLEGILVSCDGNQDQQSLGQLYARPPMTGQRARELCSAVPAPPKAERLEVFSGDILECRATWEKPEKDVAGVDTPTP